MTKPKGKKPMSEFTKQVGIALRKAGKTARKIAKMHGTPVYFVRNGKIVAEKPQ